MAEADGLGLEVLRTRRGAAFAIGEPRPDATTLIGATFAARGGRGDAIFRYYSALAHGTTFGLLQLWRRAGDQLDDVDDLDHATLEPNLTVGSLESAVRGALVAYVDAFDRVVVTHGWDRPVWDDWRRRVAQELDPAH